VSHPCVYPEPVLANRAGFQKKRKWGSKVCFYRTIQLDCCAMIISRAHRRRSPLCDAKTALLLIKSIFERKSFAQTSSGQAQARRLKQTEERTGQPERLEVLLQPGDRLMAVCETPFTLF
jgi:hypothetical protein